MPIKSAIFMINSKSHGKYQKYPFKALKYKITFVTFSQSHLLKNELFLQIVFKTNS